MVNRRYSLIWLMLLVMGSIALWDWLHPKPTSAPPPPADTVLTCQLAHISDGDTLTADCPAGQLIIRFHGIDAPEMGQQPWGKRSREQLKKLLARQSKTLELHIQDTDRYGRSVATVWANKRNIGLEMVRSGWAIAYRQYNQNPDYLHAENEARTAQRGIWASNGAHQTPSEWRRYHSAN